MGTLKQDYPTILNSLKEKIKNARLQAAITVNNLLLVVYWEIGHTINQQEQAEGWGAKIVETLAIDLRMEFPDMKGLSTRNLRYMRDFATAYSRFSILQDPVAKSKELLSDPTTILQRTVAKLPWGHNCTLLDKLKLPEERLFYAAKSVENGWSRDVLILQIEHRLYKRQGNAITNFATTLLQPQSDLARETLKNPYVFDFLSFGEKMQERDLEKALIKHIKKFMLELGRGFAYVGNQYNLNVEGDDYFLDLLFYNYQLHCFVVFELKVGAFKPEFAGKLNFYINTINAQIKGAEDKPTIGVLLCKTPNETVVRFALKGVDAPIGVADYKLISALPQQLKAEMPSMEELEKELKEEAEKLKKPIDKKLNRLKEMLSNLKNEEVQKEKDAEDVHYIFNEVLRNIESRIKEKLKDVLLLFAKVSFNRIINNNSNEAPFKEVVEQIKSENINKLCISITLENFRKAGTKAFNVWKNLEISLEPYKYSIGPDINKVWSEKLYHQKWTADELQELTDKFCEEIIEDITLKIENMNN